MGLLAHAYGRAGQVDAALRVLRDALLLVASTGETFDEATLVRIQAELMLQSAIEKGSLSTMINEIEISFHRAISLARHQGAKSIELQAALSLARHCLRQGKHRAARASRRPCVLHRGIGHARFESGTGTAEGYCSSRKLMSLAWAAPWRNMRHLVDQQRHPTRRRPGALCPGELCLTGPTMRRTIKRARHQPPWRWSFSVLRRQRWALRRGAGD